MPEDVKEVKPGKVFRLGLYWEPEEWDEFEQARLRYNEEQHLDLAASGFLRYVVRRYVAETRPLAVAADEQRTGTDRRKAS